MSKADKKQRHKSKRDAKKLAARRRNSISPLKRLADAPGETICWMSEDFQGFGQAQMFVYKQAAGMTGIACFLVDRGVVGLKDAWTRMHIGAAEVDDILNTCRRQGFAMNRVDVEDVRRMVAGGLRWAHDNGMRHPKDWAKTASVIGGVGDWASADVSEFVKEFAGHPEDLRQRLIGEPLDTYLKRSDIDFEFSEGAPYMDQKTGEYHQSNELGLRGLDEDEIEEIASEIPIEELTAIVERLTPAANGLVEQTQEWLKTQNDDPSAELLDAWRSVMAAAMLSKAAMPDASEDEVADFGFDLLEDMAKRIDEVRYEEYHRAVGQALKHLATDTLMMQKAVLKFGLKAEPGETVEPPKTLSF